MSDYGDSENLGDHAPYGHWRDGDGAALTVDGPPAGGDWRPTWDIQARGERTDPSVLVFRHDDVAAGWEQWYLALGCVHWDNPHCDRRLLYRHLDQAKERKARIFSVGDFFCVMQGKYDPRHKKSEVRPEHNVNNYLDALVNTAARDMERWGDWWEFLGDGNHEWAIEDRLETSLTERLAERLGVHRMYSWGFFRLQFSGKNGHRASQNVYWSHGTGGGGPVTRGVIGTNRRNAYVDGADLLINAHVHERWDMETPMVRVTDSGKIEIVEREHIQLGTYKQEFTARGYHVRQQRPPKPIGGYWIHLVYDSRKPGCVRRECIKTD